MFGRSSATPDSRLPILYDGGPLIYAPGGPAALHLLELLEALPDSIDPWLALPGQVNYLPDCSRLRVIIEPTRNRLRWEQITLARLAQKIQPGLVHLTSARSPIFSSTPCVISPADVEGLYKSSGNSGLLSRLSESLGRGGLSRASAFFWPADLLNPVSNFSDIRVPFVRLPPRVHSAFYLQQSPASDLPDAYVFCPAPIDETDLINLAAAWRWVNAGPGENYSLLIENLSAEQQTQIEQFFEQAGPHSPVLAISLPDVNRRAEVIQRADLVLICGPVIPWGDTLLQALACERPIAAIETPACDARLGPAGYLAPPGDARTLAAAIITLLVEESLREQIIAAAHARAAAWQSDRFSTELENACWRIYRRVNAT